MQSPVTWDENEAAILSFAGIILPSEEYATIITTFPGTNCVREFDVRGKFFIDFNIYRDGRKQFEISTEHTSQDGCLHISFDDVIPKEGGDQPGLMIAQYWHSKKIPVELYLSFLHRRSGAYLPYPTGAFMGDDLYPGAHSQEMENAQFWPGMTLNDSLEHGIVILNPHPVSYMYQISLFVGSTVIARAEARKAKPYRHETHIVEELFAEYLPVIQDANGCASICVSGQFKVLANMMIRHKESGFVTTLDHLHRYCMI